MTGIPWSKIFTFTAQDLTKVLLTAVIILIVTKVQVFSDKLSALLIALPLTSLLAMIWMYQARQPTEKIAGHSEGTFWFVLPTLPMFLILPWMLRNGWSFWSALGANCVLTTAFFWITVVLLRKFGIDLMPK
jgi:ABC-type multidrug transport system permease subunit